ncbi:hypothetical protein ACFVRR_07720 [Gottfriedia sp. NPDC057948]|uniref:hypothetical protein n=1 Tax=Gottfriedia sp. NPDC057948 TaxID=3346287 RepID=UPI0036DA04B3
MIKKALYEIKQNNITHKGTLQDLLKRAKTNHDQEQVYALLTLIKLIEKHVELLDEQIRYQR